MTMRQVVNYILSKDPVGGIDDQQVGGSEAYAFFKQRGYTHITVNSDTNKISAVDIHGDVVEWWLYRRSSFVL